jgi:hypothetical protein
MFTTSLAVLALATVSSLGGTSQPAWQTDYRVAIERAHELHKPIAVFIAKSPAEVLKGIPFDSQKVLQSGYIALMVTTDTDAGRRLAERFELMEGLVISDSTGSLQAFRSPGAVSSHELVQTLERFANPNLVVRTTENLAAATPIPVMTTGFSVPAPSMVSHPAPIMVQPAPSIVPTITVPALTATVCRT